MHQDVSTARPRLLVIGGAGSIGSHCLRELAPRLNLVVADNLSRGFRDAVLPQARFYQVDLRDASAMLDLLRHEPVDVIHCAAMAYVGESMREPVAYFANNVLGTLNLLEAMRAHGVSAIVFSSTCSVYGAPTQMPITESSPITPMNPYGESKAMAERLLHWHDVLHGIRFVALRYFNAAGAAQGCGERHQPETHAIPLLLQAAAGQGVFEIYGEDYPPPDGTCVRDYIHVADLASAHRLGMQHLLRGPVSLCLILGSGQGASIRGLIRAAEAVTGKSIQVRSMPRRPGDPPTLVADPSRAAAVLGWRAQQSEIVPMVASAWSWARRGQEQVRTAVAGRN